MALISLMSNLILYYGGESMEEGEVEGGAELLLIRVRIPELSAEKCLQFQREERVWEVKQQMLAAMPKVGHT